jgi:glycosyltransferase involved in cell wall biosynthesis
MNWWGGANAFGTVTKGGLRQFTDSRGWFPAISNTFPMPKRHSIGLNRPYYNARGGDVLRWYYPLVRWLEREGIDYDLQTDYDIALDGSLLELHDQIILSPGMKFWTRSMIDGLTAAKVRGADILSLGTAARQRRISLDVEGGAIRVGEKFGGGKREVNPLLRAKDGGWSKAKPWGDLLPTIELTRLGDGCKVLIGMRGNEWDLLDEDELVEGEVVKPLTLDGDVICSYLIEHTDRTWTLNAGTNNWSWALDEFGQHENVETDTRIAAMTKQLLRINEPQKDANPEVLVSVVMTAYNVADIISPTIEAILAQQHSNLELIVVDDASTDGTFQTILAFAERDARVRPYRMVENRGTYFAKNFGFCHARGEVVTTQDADDISLPTRLVEELNALLASKTAVAVTCDYLRRGPDGSIILNRGMRQRLSFQALMWKKKEVFERMGYFDSVRAAADDEFVNRLKLVFGGGCLIHLKRPLYEALDREGSLTNDPSHRAILTSDPDVKDAHLSSPRKAYVEFYREWHNEIRGGASPRMPFPLTRRKFPVPVQLAILSASQDETVTVSMASFPPRRERMLRVVERILPQTDRLNIYLNDYDEVPPELIDEKITVVLGKDAAGDLRDNGKFYFLEGIERGFHFTIDDDIEYPIDYVQKMILKMEQYGRHVLVGVHGVIFDQPIERFFLRRTVYGFQRNQLRDAFVNLIGTGTLGYHTSAIKLELDDFTETGMADVFIAVRAKEQGVPIICIQRPKGWLEEMSSEAVTDDDDTLWEEFRLADEKQTSLVHGQGEWNSQKYHREFSAWCRDSLISHPAIALAGLGFDVTRLMQIGMPESTGPIPVGLKPVRITKS